jgi:hypothetical protein
MVVMIILSSTNSCTYSYVNLVHLVKEIRICTYCSKSHICSILEMIGNEFQRLVCLLSMTVCCERGFFIEGRKAFFFNPDVFYKFSGSRLIQNHLTLD